MKTALFAIASLLFTLASYGQGRVAYESYVDGKVQAVKSTADGASAQVRALNGVVTGDDFALVVVYVCLSRRRAVRFFAADAVDADGARRRCRKNVCE